MEEVDKVGPSSLSTLMPKPGDVTWPHSHPPGRPAARLVWRSWPDIVYPHSRVASPGRLATMSVCVCVCLTSSVVLFAFRRNSISCRWRNTSYDSEHQRLIFLKSMNVIRKELDCWNSFPISFTNLIVFRMRATGEPDNGQVPWTAGMTSPPPPPPRADFKKNTSISLDF